MKMKRLNPARGWFQERVATLSNLGDLRAPLKRSILRKIYMVKKIDFFCSQAYKKNPDSEQSPLGLLHALETLSGYRKNKVAILGVEHPAGKS
jgi:hypothetical protein